MTTNMNNIELHIKNALKNNYEIIYNTQPISNTILENLKNEFSDSKFTLSETQDYISKLNTNKSNLTTITLYNIVINVLIKSKNDNIPYLLLHRVIKRLFIVSKIFNINKKIVYWLIPTNSNRWFPKKSVIMPKHINGGFTYITNTNNVNIYIYRREEFPKVMIHELMHHSYLDTSYLSNTHEYKDTLDKMKHICNISKDTLFLPNEGIIEAWALILQSLFISYEYNIPFKLIIDIEKKWSIKQTSRILYHKYHNLNNIWKEDTNSYCYIVLKTFLINNVTNFIYHSLNKTIYNYYIENIENFILQIKPKNIKHDSFRMSVYGNM